MMTGGKLAQPRKGNVEKWLMEVQGAASLLDNLTELPHGLAKPLLEVLARIND